MSADPAQNGPPVFTVNVVLPFPYLSGLRHWDGDFDVKVKFVCTPEQLPPGFPYAAVCPSSVKADVTAISRNDDPASARIYHGVVLSRNTDQTVASFRAYGKCRVFAPSGDTDCSL